MARLLFTFATEPRLYKDNKNQHANVWRNLMSTLTGKSKVLRIAVFALMVMMAMPVTSLAQGRGRGRGRDRDFDRSDRKCEKFVNCHDARDGRWDGRGPRRRFDDRFRSGRFRNRDFDDDDFRRLQRRRRFRDRDFDDDFWRERRRRFLIEQYRNDQYYNYNPYGYQRGFQWTDLLNLFLQ